MRTYALEMMLATLMVTCGLTFLLPGETFGLPHYDVMRSWVSETVGGWVLTIAGVLRWLAILRNGYSFARKGRSYTPLFRVGGCAIGAGFWLTMAISLETAILEGVAVSPPLLLAVAGTVFVFELYSAIRGGQDAEAFDSLGARQRCSKVK